MSEERLKLYQKLWDIANILRGKMDASEFKNYMLGFIFYKFLSEKLEAYINSELEFDNITFGEACRDKKFKKELKEEAVKHLGFFLEPEFLFKSVVAKAEKKEFILSDIEKMKNYIEESTNQESYHDFEGLFDDVDLHSNRLGKSEDDKNKTISEILKKLNQVDFKFADTDIDVLGDAYEYLIGAFASDAGKKAGEFYTPQQVSKILAKIVTLNKKKLKNAYDPTCGSGSLLLSVRRELGNNVYHLSGQEYNQTTYNLARMNMILHGVKFSDFDIEQGDTIEEPQHVDTRYEAVVANPPFSAKWSANTLFLDDERFSAYGRLAPSSKADFAFVQHMIYQLDDNGIMAVVLPHGVLFRGSAEGQIRKFLIEDRNYLDAVIGLPANLFYGTSIPTCVLVFKKCRVNSDNVLFIDASSYFEKRKNMNYLNDEDVGRIIDIYKNRESVDKYSHIATLDEIRENDYNLNISRYVDTFEEEELIDLDKVVADIEALEADTKAVDAKIAKYCNELGIKAPII